MKRVLAFLMAAVITLTSIPAQTVHAAELPEKEGVTEEVMEEEIPVAEEETQTEAEEVPVEEEEIPAEEEEIPAEEEIPVEEEEDVPVEVERTLDLNYVYMDYEQIPAGEMQNIVISLGGEDQEFISAELHLLKNEKEEMVLASSASAGNAVLFSHVFSEVGADYQLVKAEYQTGDGKGTLTFASEMDAVVFSVVSDDSETQEESQVTAEVVTFDENGNVDSEHTVEDALETAAAEVNANPFNITKAVSGTGSEPVVIVLDPGHDSGGHGGAAANGLYEQDLTLKIANYCKEELEKYSGVEIYMTRSSSACPHPGTTSGECNAARVAYAKSVGADAYVSFHLNSALTSSASGAEVYYPNDNYQKWIGDEGEKMAAAVQAQLKALGLKDRGIKIRNSEEEKTYEDGSLADYYGVIKRSKESGFPGIIIEHAFITNSGDVSNFLSSNSGLKKLGIADAKGIIKYFNLSVQTKFTYDSFVVTDADINTGKITVALNKLTPYSSAYVSRVEVDVWNGSNGKDDLATYTMKSLGGGNYTFEIDALKHGLINGTYFAEAYVVNKAGSRQLLERISTKLTMGSMEEGEASVLKRWNDSYSSFTLGVGNLPYENITKVKFSVWNEAEGRASAVSSYGANYHKKGWYKSWNISSLSGAGTYYAAVYVYTADGTSRYIGRESFVVEAPEGNISVAGIDAESGTFALSLDGVSSKAGIKTVLVSVWSQEDKSDLYRYTAVHEGNGSYFVSGNIKNHGYHEGSYTVSATILDNNGCKKVVKTDFELIYEEQPFDVRVEGSLDQTFFQVYAKNLGYRNELKQAEFAVWSEAGGKDDLIWYTGTKDSVTGEWTYRIPISNHRTAGSYKVGVYARLQDGSRKLAGTTAFFVDGPQSADVMISNVNNDKGAFTVNVSNINAVSGVGNVTVTVWSKEDKSNIYSYKASESAAGVYTAEAAIRYHDFAYGEYSVRVFVTDKTGIKVNMGTWTQTLTPPTPTTWVTGNAAETVFTARIKGQGYAGQLSKVQFAVWGERNGQNDIRWYDGVEVSSTGAWYASIKPVNHKEAGNYQVQAFVCLLNGQKICVGTSSFSVKGPSAEKMYFRNVDTSKGTFGIVVQQPNSASGVDSVTAEVWVQGRTKDLYRYPMKRNSNGNYVVTVDYKKHKEQSGIYKATIVVKDKNGISRTVFTDSCELQVEAGYRIMGESNTTVAQMVAYYNANASYPSYYSDTEASTIKKFCQIYMEEAKAEGVRAEVAFCQAMKETGWLRFGGDVDISQYNFAGLGATGGVPGLSFESPRIGIRAQIQHLKAYATTEALNQECVDPRYKYVTKGCAPYVEWLGQQENPNGYGWATGKDYGTNIVSRIKNLKTY